MSRRRLENSQPASSQPTEVAIAVAAPRVPRADASSTPPLDPSVYTLRISFSLAETVSSIVLVVLSVSFWIASWRSFDCAWCSTGRQRGERANGNRTGGLPRLLQLALTYPTKRDSVSTVSHSCNRPFQPCELLKSTHDSWTSLTSIICALL